MKNLTISVDEETARWARIAAAQADTSVSKWVGAHLRKLRDEEQSYALAAERLLARRPARLRDPLEPLPDRDALHER